MAQFTNAAAEPGGGPLERYRGQGRVAGQALDDLAGLAAMLLGAPLAVVRLRQREGPAVVAQGGPAARSAGALVAFRPETGAPEGEVVLPDARKAPAFASHPLVAGPPHVRFYASVPLLTPEGQTIGTLEVVDTLAREPTSAQVEALRVLARLVMDQVVLRATLARDHARFDEGWRTAEERLRRQLDFTSAITDNLAEGVCATDQEGRFTFVNPAAEAMLGWDPEELLGRHLHESIHYLGADGTPVPAEACPLFAAIREGRTMRNDDDVFIRRNGRPFPVSYATSPIVTDGQVVGAVLAFHDITERKRGEAELEAYRRQVAMSEKLSAIGTLVSGVAHEIRTPLTYVTNNLYLIQNRLEALAKSTPEAAAVLKDVTTFSTAALDGVSRVTNLVKDLRRFANPEPGRRLEAGLHEVVAVAVELFRATQRGHVQVVESLRPTGALTLDREQVQRVVLNLLINAAEAMPKGGSVAVSTRPVPGGAEIEVEDQGPGIAPEVAARMFDPFFTTKAEGTGLGLSITRRIVEAHGGTILYETQLGRGTRFRIFLPSSGAPGSDGRALTLAPSSLQARALLPPDRPASSP